jgi:APA family basic amino acid/polyamine antiporter
MPMTTDAAPTAAPARQLGFWMCTALVVGNTIGMGIFLLPASLAPYGLNATLGWIVTVLGCLALARVFARLAQVLPGEAGPYGYMRTTLGEMPAFMALWCYWISSWITNATLATGVVGYASAVYPPLADVPPAIPSLALVWLFVGVNLLGARTGGGVQVATTVLKLLPMAAIAGLGAWLLATQPATFTAHAPVVALTFDDVTAAATIALFAMLGFESATVGAANVVDPGRTLPRATIFGTLLVAAIYLTVSTVPMLLIPGDELAASTAPFATVMDRFVAPGAGRWLALFVVVSGLGCLNGWTLLCGEMTRTMAAAGTLPRGLAKINGRGAPAVGLLLTGLLATVMIWMSYSKSLVEGFTFLTKVVTAANMPMYLLCAIAWIVLWRRGVAAAAGLPVAALLGLAYLAFAFKGLGNEAFWLALGLAAAGVPVYLLMRYGRRLAAPPA